MPIRNPFARRPGLVTGDENVRPDSADTPKAPGFERVDTVGSKASSALSIASRKSQDTGEYKMSVVNDSGVYLPPSPTEKDSPWAHRRFLSRTSTDTRSSNGADIEHFSISRESFDSYRRSFDVSAKSPVIVHDPAPRQSLDSARFPRLARSAVGERRFDRQPPPTTTEEGFEDVGLGDDQQMQRMFHNQQQQQAPRKRGIFARFSENHESAPGSGASGAAPTAAATNMSRFLPGRKRGQSGQGAELGHMDRPRTAESVVAAAPEVQS